MASARQKGRGYEITASLGYGIDGRKILKSTMWYPTEGMTPVKIQKELEKQKVLWDEKVRSGQVFDEKIKLADFADRWMKDYAAKNCKKTTYNRYELLLKRINQALGHKMICDIKAPHLLEFYENLEASGVRDDTKFRPSANFAEILKKKKLTQVKISKDAGVSVAVLKSCMSGNNVREDSAKKVATALELEFKTLFTPVEPEKALAQNSVRYYHALLSSMFSTAVKWGALSENPCARVDAPKAEHREAVYLDEDEAARLLELIEKEPVQFRTAVKLLLYTGLRRGELCGLEWPDIDFDKSTLSVRRNSLYIPGEGVVEDSTKTAASVRVIRISQVTVEILKSYKAGQDSEKERLGDKWTDTGRLFTTWDGHPIHPDTVTSWFSEFAKRNGFEGLHVHSLRHSSATLLIAAGTPLVTVQKRLGHAALTTTANIYSHAVKSADAAAADTLEDILKPANALKLKNNA